MNIRYIRDDKLEYIKPVEKGLREHNRKFTDNSSPSDSFNLYLLKNKEIIACIACFSFWDWVGFERLYYKDFNALKILMNEVNKKYDRTQTAIYFKTHDDSVLSDLKKIGYKTVGILEEKPLSHTTEELADYKMKYTDLDHDFEVVIGTKDNDHYKDELDRLVNEYYDSIGYSDKYDEVFYVALDGDNVIGGVYGELSNNYLYVSVIWVDENYRGLNIACNLLEMLEEHAKKMGYSRFFLETGSFQAKGFYEKLGYKVTSKLYDFPKGYEMYTMVKILPE